jgi:hypothetical protein
VEPLLQVPLYRVPGTPELSKLYFGAPRAHLGVISRCATAAHHPTMSHYPTSPHAGRVPLAGYRGHPQLRPSSDAVALQITGSIAQTCKYIHRAIPRTWLGRCRFSAVAKGFLEACRGGLPRRPPARSEHDVEHHRCRINSDSVPDVIQHSSAHRLAVRAFGPKQGVTPGEHPYRRCAAGALGRLVYPLPPLRHSLRTLRTQCDTLERVSEFPESDVPPPVPTT